jgi:hypothetical protein
MNLKDFTYNEISFLAFGEAQAVKADIDALVLENARLKDKYIDTAYELAEMRGEIHE